jgi:hypothetical protein
MGKRILFFCLTLVLLLSACGGGEATTTLVPTRQAGVAPTPTTGGEPPAAEPTSTSAEPTATSAEQPPAAEPTATSLPEPTDETSPAGILGDLLDLGSININPEQLGDNTLQSYRLRASWSVEPKPGSTEVASDATMEIAHTSDPLAEQFTMMSGDEPGFSTIRIGDTMWFQADDQWIEVSSDDMASSMEDTLFSLNQATAGLSGDAKLVGNEDVNGIATRHYSFDETIPGMNLGIYGKIKGDVWVAEEGDYTVKYVYSAENDDATYRWDWELYDINAAITIEPPADAQGARSDIPLMPDAANRSSFGPMTTYESESDAAAVIDFYKEQMPGEGWAYNEGESTISEMFNTLSFTKEDVTVTIMITPNDGGGTAVIIQAGE